MTTKTTRLTRQAAAERLQVSESTLDRMIRRGDLPTEKEKHGSRYKIWILLDEGSEQSDDGTDADSAENDAYSRRVPADKPEYSPDMVDHADDHELTALRTEVEEPEGAGRLPGRVAEGRGVAVPRAATATQTQSGDIGNARQGPA